MNREDPTDIVNVSVEAIAERKAALAAAEAKAKARPKQTESGPPKGVQQAQAQAQAAMVKQALKQDVQREEDPKTPLLDRVMRYRERFPALKSRNKNLSVKSQLAEFHDELHYIEQQLGADINAPGQTGKLGNVAFIATMSGLEYTAENVWNPLGLKLQGLGTTTASSISTFEPLLDELVIKHGLDMTASVEWRLAMLVGSTVLTVHLANADDPAGKQLLAKLADATTKGSAKNVSAKDAKEL